MHMPGAAADGAIVTPAALTQLAWQRLQPERWPLPRQAFPAGAALVGGAVRDALLDRLAPQPDLDLVVEGDAVQLCRQLSRTHGGRAVVLDAERSIARLVIRGWSIDLARREGESVEADLRRRDYTINAIALPLADAALLLDPLEGLKHLQAGLLVAVAEQNLLDDPLRLLRGLRLAGELGFEVEPRSLAWLQQHHHTLAAVAGERVLAELEKLAAAPHGERELARCLELQLLAPWCDRGDAKQLQRCNALNARALGLTAQEQTDVLALARLAACLSGAGLRQLNSSRKLQQRVERLRHWQAQVTSAASADALTDAERVQLHRDLDTDLPALLLGWSPERAATWMQRWRDPNDPLFHPRPALDGGSLQRDLGMRASPELGQLLHHLMVEQAFGRISSRADALQQAQQWLESPQLRSEGAPRRD
jgi:tRNA nucleotidyltransferase (CCA-adding enzyme)